LGVEAAGFRRPTSTAPTVATGLNYILPVALQARDDLNRAA
jgi:hypothetical protein